MNQHALPALMLCGVVATCSAQQPYDVNWVRARVNSWQPTARERSWEAIHWSPNLAAALQTASTLRRPVFLFTHDGRIALGRC